MSKNSRNKQKKTITVSRRGVIMVAMIAALVLAFNLITASYSWFSPDTDNTGKQSLSYTNEAPMKLRSENCTVTTYRGTKATAAVVNDDNYTIFKNQIDYGTNAVTSVSMTAGTTYYFKTEIHNGDTGNDDTNYPADVSLYIASMPAGTIAVTYPSNSVRKITSAQPDYYIIRNAYVKKYVSTDVNGPGLLEVEWFITPTSNATINLSNLYLMYN